MEILNSYIDYERQVYRWVQLTLDEAHKEIAKFSGLHEAGYLYVDAEKGVDMVDFRIGNCEEFTYLIKGTHYGGFLSFRFLEDQRPVMNIGHDEYIFEQYIFLQSCGRFLMGKLY